MQQLATRGHGTRNWARHCHHCRQQGRRQPVAAARARMPYKIQSWDRRNRRSRRGLRSLWRKGSLNHRRLPLRDLQNALHIPWRIRSSFTWRGRREEARASVLVETQSAHTTKTVLVVAKTRTKYPSEAGRKVPANEQDPALSSGSDLHFAGVGEFSAHLTRPDPSSK